MTRHVVARTCEIPPGERKRFTIKGRPIAVFNLDNAFYGMLDRCPHQGGSLCAGVTTGLVISKEPGRYDYIRKGEFIRCPWHGWEFDIRTGQSYCDPERIRSKSYSVSAESGANVVAGPYVAETIPVAVEEDYIVVDV